MHPVTFLPSGKTVAVDAHTTLLQAASQAGLLIDAPCGGGGVCAKCRVRVRSGRAATGGSAQRLTPQELEQGWRLACATPVEDALAVEIPDASRLGRLDTILVDGDPVSLRRDPHSAGHLGIAFDLGTTTVAGCLYDLHTGLERATRAAMNRQIARGDDVISRIAAVRHDAAALRRLQADAVATLNALTAELCAACGEPPGAVRRLAVAGNTTMQQLLLGLDPSPLGERPFTPAFTDLQTRPAAELGLAAHPEALLTVFPQVGGFVGGDTVAGLLAAHFDTLTKPTLLIDIGTNGEIALLHDGVITAASTAAGPAFEGARIRQGMRASAGAIDHVWLHGDDVHLHVLGETEPLGLCGSALVDTVAVLLQLGVIDAAGSLAGPDEPPPGLGDALRRRLQRDARGTRFVLAFGEDGRARVSLTQQDVRELQLASGALRAGIEALLRKAGLEAKSLDAILLAGGFGNYIRRENALRIGLLPPVHYLTIRFIGNASLTGAKRALLAQAECARAQALGRRTRHVELAAEPHFADLFTEHMFFPEADTAGA